MKMLKIISPLILCFGLNLKAQIPIHLSQSCDALDRVKDAESFPMTFDPSAEAQRLTEAIMEIAGAPANFELRFAAINGIEATSDQGKRYLLYSTRFLKKFDQESTYWGAYFMLAHEIGHHLKKHDFEWVDPQRIKYTELEADVFAGAALCMLGASLQEALEGLAFLSLPGKTASRPAKSSRLEAVALGWKRQNKKLNHAASLNNDAPFELDIEITDQSAEQILIQRIKDAERHKRAINIPASYGLGPVGGKPGNGATNGGYGENPFGKSNGSGGGPGGGSGTSAPTNYSTSSGKTSMPNFPWPPPNCYQRKTLVKNLSKKALNFDDIDERLQRALDAEGYYQRSYFQTPGGFALITQMEQFKPDGTTNARFRWTDYPVQEDFDGVWTYFKSLIMPNPGHFRVFVFVVTNQPYPLSDKTIVAPGMQKLASGGLSQIPSSYSKTEVTQEHYLEVLIYEFEAPQSTKQCTEKCPAFLDVQTHLAQSGLSNLLGF